MFTRKSTVGRFGERCKGEPASRALWDSNAVTRRANPVPDSQAAPEPAANAAVAAMAMADGIEKMFAILESKQKDESAAAEPQQPPQQR